MIPVLYEPKTKKFDTNGIGRLSDTVSCIVTETRNGEYELEMQYPITGAYYDEIELASVILAQPGDGGRRSRLAFIRFQGLSGGL